jgi:metacaspase-1
MRKERMAAFTTITRSPAAGKLTLPDMANPFHYTLSTEAIEKKHGQYGRKAVLFGVNKYMIGEEATLSGCVYDVNDMAVTLRLLGWPKTGIHVVTDKYATTDRWYKEMKWLTDGAGPGDTRAYMQSSHGTQKWDWSGDEPDQRDEMPVMHNFSFDDESTHITDDTIREEYVKKVDKETRCEIILDTCHSGTGARSLFDFGRYGRTKLKFLPNPDFQIINGTLPSLQKRKWFGNSNVDKDIVVGDDVTENNGTIYACQDFDYAYETAIQIGGQWIVRGLMTYNLCDILRQTGGNITRKELGEQLLLRVSTEANQQPGYECSNVKFYNQYPFRRGHQDSPEEMARM